MFYQTFFLIMMGLSAILSVIYSYTGNEVRADLAGIYAILCLGIDSILRKLDDLNKNKD